MLDLSPDLSQADGTVGKPLQPFSIPCLKSDIIFLYSSSNNLTMTTVLTTLTGNLNLIFTESQVFTPPLKSEKKMKKVSFGRSIQIILIPTIEEFRAAGLTDHLWYNKRDYDSFKLQAKIDAATVMIKAKSSFRMQPFTELYLKDFQELIARKNAQHNLLCSSSSSLSSLSKVAPSSEDAPVASVVKTWCFI
jgi:hypothetical protein